MIGILFWVSIISGGLLLLLLLLSLVGGIDLEFDLPGDMDIDVDVDADSGGLGTIKAFLTFVSIGCWVIRLVWFVSLNPWISLVGGIVGGSIAVFLLSKLLKLLLKNQQFNVWDLNKALYKKYKVYLKVPALNTGEGKITIILNNSARQIKAVTEGEEIPTGAEAEVTEVNSDGSVTVKAITKKLQNPLDLKNEYEKLGLENFTSDMTDSN